MGSQLPDCRRRRTPKETGFLAADKLAESWAWNHDQVVVAAQACWLPKG